MQNALRRTMNACSRRLVWCSVGGFLKTFPPPVRVLDECLVAVRDAVRHIPHYHHTAASPFRRRQSVRRHYYNIAMRVRVCAHTRPVPPPPLGGAASCTRELILYCCRRVYYLYNIRECTAYETTRICSPAVANGTRAYANNAFGVVHRIPP